MNQNLEISAKDFAHSLTLRETQIKIKLIKKNNTPHLKIDLVSNSIVNEVPITFIMVKNWAEYNLPNIGTPSVYFYCDKLIINLTVTL